MQGRLCSAAPRAAPRLTLPVLSQSCSHPALWGTSWSPSCPSWTGTQVWKCRAAARHLPSFKDRIYFPLGIYPLGPWGCWRDPRCNQALTGALPSPIQAVPAPAAATPLEPHTGRTATYGECLRASHAMRAAPARRRHTACRHQKGIGEPASSRAARSRLSGNGSTGPELGGGGRCQMPLLWHIRSREPGALSRAQVSAHAFVGAACSTALAHGRAGCRLPTRARDCWVFSGRAGPSPACPSLTGRVCSWQLPRLHARRPESIPATCLGASSPSVLHARSLLFALASSVGFIWKH